MNLRVEPDCFVGEPLEFANWRLLLARAAGFGVEGWEHDDITFLLPALDYENMSTENILGIWDIEPEDVLIVLLAHSDEEGAIYPVHLEPLAARIEELLPELTNFSQYADGSPQQTTELLVTEKFVKALRSALEQDLAITFHCEDVN